jgi:1-acyl-sn-glycerol-3-phosphate acyltransferase
MARRAPEPTFRTLEILAQLIVLASGSRIAHIGEENVPDQGGAVIAINHTSYVELKDFKTGATRMASEADVPIVPVNVWGSQRIWTKGHRKRLHRDKVPITVAVGVPLGAGGCVARDVPHDPAQTNAALRASMTTLLHQVQRHYPQPAGAYWVPRRLGGTAPTLAEAAQLNADEAAARAASRTPHQSR